VPRDELAPSIERDVDGHTRVIRQRVDSRLARLGSEPGAVHSGLKGTATDEQWLPSVAGPMVFVCGSSTELRGSGCLTLELEDGITAAKGRLMA
jgi:hypothetical protein